MATTNYQQPQTMATNNLVMPQGQPQPAAQGAPQQPQLMSSPFSRRTGGAGPYGGIAAGQKQPQMNMLYPGGTQTEQKRGPAPGGVPEVMTDMRYRGPGGERGQQPAPPGVPQQYQQAGPYGGIAAGQQQQFPIQMLSGPQGQQQLPQQPAPSSPQSTYSVDQFQQWARQRYGREATPQELQQLAQQVGYTGGNITQDQWNQAQTHADTMARQQGWQGPSNGQPEQPNWGQDPSRIDPVTGEMFGPQYQNPYQQQQQELMQQILGSGGSMNQTVQDQMFEQQKEQANDMARQFGLMGQQQVAGRGFGPGGAAAGAMRGQQQDNMMRELLGGRRNIAAQAAQVNRQDQLNAINQSMGLDQQAYGQHMGNRGAQLQEWLAQRGNQMDTRRQGAQEEQFRRSMELEYQRFLEQQRQFNSGMNENQRQFNNQMGFNYTNMNNNNNNSFIRYLMGG